MGLSHAPPPPPIQIVVLTWPTEQYVGYGIGWGCLMGMTNFQSGSKTFKRKPEARKACVGPVAYLGFGLGGGGGGGGAAIVTYVPLLTLCRRFDLAITRISHRPQPEYTRD